MITSKYTDDFAYALDAIDMRILETLRKRLYDDKPLSHDQRRDLANTLDAVLHKAVAIRV